MQLGLSPGRIFTKLAKEIFWQLDFILKQSGTAPLGIHAATDRAVNRQLAGSRQHLRVRGAPGLDELHELGASLAEQLHVRGDGPHGVEQLGRDRSGDD